MSDAGTLGGPVLPAKDPERGGAFGLFFPPSARTRSPHADSRPAPRGDPQTTVYPWGILAADVTGLTAVSVFSGGGGADYGLALAGFRTRLTVEIEPYACRTLREAQDLGRVMPDGHRYLEGVHIFEGDVADLSGPAALRLARLRAGEVDLLVGGAPCVTFSVAGKREGLTSETGRLYAHFVRLLKAFRPQAFVFENVKGLLTAMGTDGKGSAFETVLGAMKTAGYALTWRVVDAADYGVPQHRHRVIVLGRRGLRALVFPEPTHDEPMRTGFLPDVFPWRSVRDAFKDLPAAVTLGEKPRLANHVAKRHSPSVVDSFRATPPGTRNRLYQRDRLLWDEPGKTVRAQGKLKADGSGQKHSSHAALHPDEPRQLTPRECARLQTFPDWYPFPDTLVNAYRIIGDAIPCELARVIGTSIAAQLRFASNQVAAAAD